MSPEEFYSRYKDWAIQSMAVSGVPASITLAQGAIESAYGESRLAREGNNFFGIKVGPIWQWNGPYILADDNKPNEKFRKYKTVYDSFVDHADFLRVNDRYNSLFKNTNYIEWANGLERAGYATDPDYAEKLIGTIEKYKLYEYDKIGEMQMQGLQNTIVRNVRPYRYQIYLLLAIGVLIVMMYIIKKKFLK